MTTVISFYPKFEDLDEEAVDKTIAEYRAWLDQHGDYGRLYMMDIGKLNVTDINAKQLGFRIFDHEIALLFKMMFNV
jgi:hypothetical protein